MRSALRILRRMNLKEALAPVDPLGEALHFLRMSGIFYCRSEFTAPWGLALPPMEDSLMFHVVTSGHCWLEVDGAKPHLLQPGEFALVPHGEGHRLGCEPGGAAAKLFDLPREQVTQAMIDELYQGEEYGTAFVPADLSTKLAIGACM